MQSLLLYRLPAMLNCLELFYCFPWTVYVELVLCLSSLPSNLLCCFWTEFWLLLSLFHLMNCLLWTACGLVDFLFPYCLLLLSAVYSELCLTWTALSLFFISLKVQIKNFIWYYCTVLKGLTKEMMKKIVYYLHNTLLHLLLTVWIDFAFWYLFLKSSLTALCFYWFSLSGLCFGFESLDWTFSV